MSARVLTFRSAASVSRPQTAGALATAPRALVRHTSSSAPKVLIMTKPMRHSELTRKSLNELPSATVLGRLQAELTEGYFEVPTDGVAFKQLVYVYAEMLRETRERMLNSIRSLFRLHPAH